MGKRGLKKKPRTVGYLRVSTHDQDTDKNKNDILQLANEKRFGHVEWVTEKVSGKKSWKERRIKQVIDQLGEGDRLIVPELSRLGRSMLEIMEMLSVARQKGIYIYSVKGSWELNGTIQSKVMAMAFSIACGSAAWMRAMCGRRSCKRMLKLPKCHRVSRPNSRCRSPTRRRFFW